MGSQLVLPPMPTGKSFLLAVPHLSRAGGESSRHPTDHRSPPVVTRGPLYRFEFPIVLRPYLACKPIKLYCEFWTTTVFATVGILFLVDYTRFTGNFTHFLLGRRWFSNINHRSATGVYCVTSRRNYPDPEIAHQYAQRRRVSARSFWGRDVDPRFLSGAPPPLYKFWGEKNFYKKPSWIVLKRIVLRRIFSV